MLTELKDILYGYLSWLSSFLYSTFSMTHEGFLSGNSSTPLSLLLPLTPSVSPLSFCMTLSLLCDLCIFRAHQTGRRSWPTSGDQNYRIISPKSLKMTLKPVSSLNMWIKSPRLWRYVHFMLLDTHTHSIHRLYYIYTIYYTLLP